MALITRLDSAVANGSTLPLALPSIGVDDYAARWIANQVAGSDGVALPSWPAAYGTNRDLASPGGTASPTLKVAGADKFVQFDGTGDVLTQSVTSAAWITTIALVRVDVAASTSGQLLALSASTGPWLSRSSTNLLILNGGSNVNVTGPTLTSAQWRVVSMVQNGASSLCGVDTTISTGTAGTRAVSALMLGKTDAGFGAVSVAEAAVYNRALSASELQTVATALRANHAALVA